MTKVYIVKSARTPEVYQLGNFEKITDQELMGKCMQAITKKEDEIEIDEIVGGVGRQRSTPSNLARHAIFLAGGNIDQDTSAYTVNMLSASSGQALALAYYKIMAGNAKRVLAGGAESSSSMPVEIIDARYKFNEDTEIIYDPYRAMVEKSNFDEDKIDENNVFSVFDKYDLNDENREILESIEEDESSNQDLLTLAFSVKKKKKVIEVTEDERAEEFTGYPSLGDASCMMDLRSEDGLTSDKPLAEIVGVLEYSEKKGQRGFLSGEKIKAFLDKNQVSAKDIKAYSINEFSLVQASKQLDELESIGIDKKSYLTNASNLTRPLVVGASGAVKLHKIIARLIDKKEKYGLLINGSEDGQGVVILVKRCEE